MTTHFIVDCRVLSRSGGAHVTVAVSNPSGAATNTLVTDEGDGTYRVEYTAFEDGDSAHSYTVHGSLLLLFTVMSCCCFLP